MQRILSLFFFFLLFAAAKNSCAQTGRMQKSDSLIIQLRGAKDDTNKVKLLNHIGDEFAYNDMKKARVYYTKGYELSKKLDFTRGIIRYYSSEGELLNLEGKYEVCMSLLRKGVKLTSERRDLMRLGIMYENMGNTFGLMRQLDSAMHYYLNSMVIFEKFADSVKMANVYTNLATIFTQTDKQEKALIYADKALAISKLNKDGFYMSHLVNKAAILWKLKRYDESDRINDEIISLAIKLHDDVGLADALQSYCSHCIERRNYTKLSDFTAKLAGVASRLQSNDRLAVSNYWLATDSYYRRKLDPAKQYITRSITLASADNNRNRLKECYQLYAKILLVGGGVEQSEFYASKADSLERIMFNADILKTTRDLEAKYETNKKEALIQIQSTEIAQRRRVAYILGVSLLLTITALILFFLWMRNRQRVMQQQKLIQQQKITQLENEKQIEATLSVIKGQEEERSRLAKDLHDGLGGILSGAKYSFKRMKQNFVITEDNALAFEKSMAMLDESIAELRRVAHNMMPETLMKLSLNEALQDYCHQAAEAGPLPVNYHSLGMDDLELDNTIKISVYRVVQELITNTLKHAGATHIIVQLVAKDHILQVTVEDDGKGFDTSQAEYAKGIGYKNIRSRIDALKGKLDVESGEGQGTSVYIEIPL
jgi:two-component system NarL family sensor kinase